MAILIPSDTDKGDVISVPAPVIFAILGKGAESLQLLTLKVASLPEKFGMKYKDIKMAPQT